MSATRFDGPTLDAALHRAASELGCSHQELAYRVVEEGAGGIVVEAEIDPHAVLGLFLVGTFATKRGVDATAVASTYHSGRAAGRWWVSTAAAVKAEVAWPLGKLEVLGRRSWWGWSTSRRVAWSGRTSPRRPTRDGT